MSSNKQWISDEFLKGWGPAACGFLMGCGVMYASSSRRSVAKSDSSMARVLEEINELKKDRKQLYKVTSEMTDLCAELAASLEVSQTKRSVTPSSHTEADALAGTIHAAAPGTQHTCLTTQDTLPATAPQNTRSTPSAARGGNSAASSTKEAKTSEAKAGSTSSKSVVKPSELPSGHPRRCLRNTTATDIFAEADNLVDHLEDDIPGNVHRAHVLLLKIYEKSEGATRGEAAWRISETCSWLGLYSKSREDKDKYWSMGVDYGKTSMELLPHAVEPYVWYGAAMGQHCVLCGIMQSLFYLGPIQKCGDEGVRIDEDYYYGGPLRLLGNFYLQAPGWPVSSGDKKKAVELFERAYRKFPFWIPNATGLAKAYIAVGQKERGAQVLDDAIATKCFDPMFEKRMEMFKKEARTLRSRL
eukprot:Rmarinus@m.10698